jgi:hypothetical protein
MAWSLLAAIAGGLPAHAKFPPDTEWETVRTAHFRVHYPPSYRRFTAYLTAYLEEAYDDLSEDLHWTLEGPADVVVRGDTDVPNGQAQVFPMNRLIIHAVPFSPTGAIGEYDNWIRTLAFHELTHLVANDTTRGFFATARSIFGSAAKMNPYQPQWLVEGLAVYEETARSTYGRGRSAFADMVIRTAARDGRLDDHVSLEGVTLDRLNDGVPYWPGGATPYLYGYVVNELIAEAGGPGAPGRNSQLSGARLPFFINGVVEAAIGKDYYALWATAVERMKAAAERDLATIRARPVTTAESLISGPAAAHVGRLSGGVVVSADGKRVHFVRDSRREGLGLSAVDTATGTLESLSEWEHGGGTGLRSDPAGRWLLYSRYRQFEEYRLYSDIHLWDVAEGRERRVTAGARALDPDCSPDFDWDPREGRIRSGALVYVKNLGDGNQAIARLDRDGERVLHRFERFERVAAPAWGWGASADWIVFALRVNGGSERLLALHAGTGRLRAVTRQATPGHRVSEMTPSWTRDGSLLFASSVGGVYNIYRIEARALSATLARTGGFAKAARVTNLETGAVYPAEWPGRTDLVAMHYGSRGFAPARLAAAEQKDRPVLLQPLRLKLYPEKARPPEKPAELEPEDLEVDTPDPQEDHPEGTAEKYSAWPALWPKYWLPFGQRVANGWILGVSTSGHDALEKHLYSVIAAWDTRSDFPVYGVAYQFDGLYPSIQVTRSQENKYLGLFDLSNRVETTGLALHYPIRRWGVSFGGTVSTSRFFSQESGSGGLQARVTHTDLHSYPDSIDPGAGEKGHWADLTFTGYLAGDDQYSSIEGHWDQRIPSPLSRHFVRLFASGARATNTVFSALYFVGGGETGISALEGFLVRGYKPGLIYGRSIGTVNLEYWMPFADVFRGRGTLPAFYERAKLKLFVDTGSAEFVGSDRSQFGYWPVGAGVQLLQDVKVLYRFPFTVALGFDWGLSDRFGGEKQLVIGLYGRVN